MKQQHLINQIERELSQISELIAQVEMLLKLTKQVENQDLQKGLVSGLALHLHSFYTGAERIFYNISRDIDDEVPTGSDWHRQLLDQMIVEIPETRSPVLAEQTWVGMDEFRRFRHVVRSRYAYQLDPDRVQALAEQMSPIAQSLIQNCQRFCAEIQAFERQDLEQ